MDYPDLEQALKALAKETKKPVALLKTNYDAGDQLIVGRIHDLMGIKATSRETNNIKGTSPAPKPEYIATRREIQTELPIEPDRTEAINATGREKKKRGRPATGTKPMTSAERVRLSRYRRKYPDISTAYSGKMLSTMLSGEAHSALDDLLNKYSVLSQKEIIEMAIIKLNRKGE